MQHHQTVAATDECCTISLGIVVLLLSGVDTLVVHDAALCHVAYAVDGEVH
jgi:ADP-heptose:LPS heptosyltransferase